jgi:hypothetical protein
MGQAGKGLADKRREGRDRKRPRRMEGMHMRKVAGNAIVGYGNRCEKTRAYTTGAVYG